MENISTSSQSQVAFEPAPVSLWHLPPTNLILGSDEVHVWQASLDDPHLLELQQTLSADERARADRFRFEKDRRHFIVARGLLRTILGNYLNTKPGQLQFCYSPYGKPALTGESGGSGIKFNLSHSHGLALYAITRHREVGVDLEFIQPHLADERTATQFFSPREVAMLRALSRGVKEEAFFNCWTRKEAYLKARGEGLAFPLAQFDVSLAPNASALLLRNHQDPQEISRWSLRKLSLQPDYAAALVVEGHDWRLKCWRWAEGS